ncbi:hypothetical protein BT63DRAFT_412518 [Microthyrium microscopicum]|uniref:DUF1275 domain protein n=1 Tax=Microthyrium microscopicum TaxID=703497 RepID=A0A6A6UH26_9PEZI|nr:hypothetical protein BT63DRAFT_412518 [Microthyrium microscopicum]
MQTGNTIILALGASNQPEGHPNQWLEALIAILSFFIGAFSTSRISNLLGPLRRSTLGLSFFVQGALIAIAAALVQAEIVPGLHPDSTEDFLQLVPLAMLSFQAGAQCIAARHLGFNEIPTTVLTSVYCDLGNDPELFVPLQQNWKRNRRFIAVVLLLLGAIIGGWLSRTNEGMAAGLWMASAIKLIISVAWFVWRKDGNQKPAT